MCPAQTALGPPRRDAVLGPARPLCACDRDRDHDSAARPNICFCYAAVASSCASAVCSLPCGITG